MQPPEQRLEFGILHDTLLALGRKLLKLIADRTDGSRPLFDLGRLFNAFRPLAKMCEFSATYAAILVTVFLTVGALLSVPSTTRINST